ncbi:MAG: dihydrolipoyl dehydrogenase [Candidatus Omnitrophota bacterium]|nr:dihydrolipoyl dehydrogenase [Candidatus Omnitrophota bacterium]
MYDLAIIGAGWAGFNAGLKARKLGLQTVLIDKSEIGGTCLNLGCIPTKALIQSAKVFNLVKKSSAFGINTSVPAIDFVKIQERKDKIIQQLRLGMRSMLKDIDFLSAEAQILSANEIKVSGSSPVQAKNILIAAGSMPYELPQFKFDAKKILSSNEILSLKAIPGSLLIVGGGVIGCEFASLFLSLGSKVTVVEKMPQLLPGEDKETARKLENIFKKKGIKINTATDASSLNPDDFDIILVCVGRVPRTEGLGLEKLGLKLERSRIITDDYLCTNINNIYAAGDCASKIMLAHLASFQGRLAAQNIAQPDNRKSAAAACVPSCIFTDPEIASIGLSEDKAIANGLSVDIHKFDFLGSGMARILDEAEGFIKIISGQNSGIVLGASIIGPKATELIGILTLAVANSLSIKNLRQSIFAHPTLSESISEALE